MASWVSVPLENPVTYFFCRAVNASLQQGYVGRRGVPCLPCGCGARASARGSRADLRLPKEAVAGHPRLQLRLSAIYTVTVSA